MTVYASPDSSWNGSRSHRPKVGSRESIPYGTPMRLARRKWAKWPLRDWPRHKANNHNDLGAEMAAQEGMAASRKRLSAHKMGKVDRVEIVAS